MSLFNRFIESIIPAPDKDDGLFPDGSSQYSSNRRSTQSMIYGRENEGTISNSSYVKKGMLG